MPKTAAHIVGIIFALAATLPVEARVQPYMGQPGESPQLVKCKQEAQYMGAGGKAYATHMESNRLLRRDYIKKCMQDH